MAGVKFTIHSWIGRRISDRTALVGATQRIFYDLRRKAQHVLVIELMYKCKNHCSAESLTNGQWQGGDTCHPTTFSWLHPTKTTVHVPFPYQKPSNPVISSCCKYKINFFSRGLDIVKALFGLNEHIAPPKKKISAEDYINSSWNIVILINGTVKNAILRILETSSDREVHKIFGRPTQNYSHFGVFIHTLYRAFS